MINHHIALLLVWDSREKRHLWEAGGDFDLENVYCTFSQVQRSMLPIGSTDVEGVKFDRTRLTKIRLNSEQIDSSLLPCRKFSRQRQWQRTFTTRALVSYHLTHNVGILSIKLMVSITTSNRNELLTLSCTTQSVTLKSEIGCTLVVKRVYCRWNTNIKGRN